MFHRMIKALIPLAGASLLIGFAPQYTDAELIAKVIWAEARGECRQGQLLIGQTIINRVEYGFWGSDIRSVVESPGQFARIRRLCPDMLEVAEAVLAGEQYNQDVKILFFRSNGNGGDWWRPRLGEIGGHSYYGLTREGTNGQAN